MKTLLALGLMLALFTTSARAGFSTQEVRVLGTVTVEGPATGGGTEPVVSVLNNARIFAEFGVTKQSHTVVIQGSQIQLRPRLGGAVIVLLTFSEDGSVFKTANSTLRITGPTTSPRPAGLFKGFAGTFSGKGRFVPGAAKASLSFVGVSDGPQLLKFTIVSIGPFTL